MAMFKAFKPSGMKKIARSMGYQGNMQGFQDYLATNPAQQQQMELYTNKAMQMAKGGYAKNKKVKYFNEGGDAGDDAVKIGDRKSTDVNKQPGYYWHMSQRGEAGEQVLVRIGSKQDTSRARMLASIDNPGWNQGLEEYINKLAPKPYDVRVAEYGTQKKQEQEDLLAQQQKDYDAAMQRRKEEEERQKQINDPSKMVAKGIYKENPRPDIFRAYPAVEPPEGFQYAYNETGERITVPTDFGGWTSMPDPNQQPQTPIKTPEEQQQYSQQVANQMQNMFSTTQPAQPAQQPYVPPIYQAPYLSGTRFTPAGQYVQDPVTGQPVPQAYTPLNQGYGAAAANFQQQIQGGYGMPERTIDAPYYNPDVVPFGKDYLTGFGGIQGNVPYNPNMAGAIGNLAGSMLTQNMAEGGYATKYSNGGAVPPRRTDIKGQDHMLAYITPQEGELLKAYGGSGKPGPMGIPAFEKDDDAPYYNPDDWDGDGGGGGNTFTTPAAPPQYQPPPPNIPPAQKTTAAFGEEDGQKLPYKPGLIAKTQAVGEDEPQPVRPPLGTTRALGEDFNPAAPNFTTQLVGEDNPNFTGNLATGSGQKLNRPDYNIGALGGLGGSSGGFSGSLFVPDTSRKKSEQQMQDEWQKLVASAKESRKKGFLGQVVLPGEGSYEDWKQLNQYEMMRNPDAPDSLYAGFDMTGIRDSRFPDFFNDPRIKLTVGEDNGPQTPFNYPVPQVFPGSGINGQPPVTINGITYNSATRAVGETTSPPPLPNQPVQQAASGRPGGQVTNPAGTQAGTPVYTGASPTEYTTIPATYYEPGDDIPEGKKAGDEKTPEIKNPVPGVAQFSVEQMYNPALPVGGTTIAAQTQTDASQYIAAGTGELTGQVSVPTATASTTQAQGITPTDANIMQAAQAAPGVDSAMNATQAAQADPNNPNAQITAAQQTASSVGNLQAAQGNASLINNPVQRQIQQGELISGVADAQVASQFTEQIQAAQATPSQQATVQGQLANLTANFNGTNPPPWASGAIRSATAQMAARGLGASSLAGQAVIQATIESALPIAQADASVFAQFEGQNLSNRQQRAMLAAQQRAQFIGQEFDQAFQSRVQNSARIGDIANMNFTAEQQVQLENSRAVNTMNLNNLSNRQAMVMAEAAALAQLDTANLSNRQQSAVQNAQNFLQYDMANLSNRQQTELFKAQQRVQSMFTDQAATNAAAQFNATSQNQVDQFFANLGSQVSQFNATQQNAQAQFNAGQTNTVNRFNAELNNQRDQFNAQNQLVIAQSNAQWRRQIATADTAAINRANELNANAILDISKTAYNNLWNYYGDTMEWAWKSAENELERMNQLAMAELDADTQSSAAAAQRSSSSGSALGSLIATLGSAWISKYCWVAREVYGPQDYTWLVFRNWMFNKAPRWLYNLYGKHGESFAEYISDKPILKRAVKFAMDSIVKNHKMEYKRANN